MDKLTYQEAAEYLRNFNRKYGYTTKRVKIRIDRKRVDGVELTKI